jgi:DNA mismatch endonuclease (patch repair protein)
MSKVRDRDSTAELAIRRRLWANGIRYRLDQRLHGRPDLVFPAAHLAIFIDGDLWHGNSWRVRGLPNLESQFPNRTEWWVAKIQRNIARDREVDHALAQSGWTVLRYWETVVLEDPNRIAKEIAERVRNATLNSFRCLDRTALERRRLASVRPKPRP